MRRAFGSVDEPNGLSGRPAPVAGSMRRIAPSSVAGPLARRTLWLRSAPPCAVGAVSGVPAGEEQRPDRVARELLAPVVDQHLLGAGHDIAAGLKPRDASGDEAAVSGRTRRAGATVV